MKELFTLVTLIFLFSSCSTSRLVDEYSNTDNPNYRTSKVLVVGLTPDGGLQRQFEYSLTKALKEENVIAVKSVDYFEGTSNEIDQSEENLTNLKKELLADGFDTVLFSKIIGQESKVTMVQSYRNLTKSFQSFSDYYNENRPVSGDKSAEDYPVYNTETSLYCLCPDNEQDLIWRGKIDIVNPPGAATTIRDYVKTLIKTFKKNQFFRSH